VDAPSALRFVCTARALGAAARAAGLTVPAFRCPPRLPGAHRTIRRYAGGAVISVQLRERAFEQVAADMLEGVIVANRLGGEAAARMRSTLAEAAEPPHTDDARAA
jgi:hypothetical protein